MTISISLESLLHEFLVACGCKKNKQAQAAPAAVPKAVPKAIQTKPKA